ncbi:AAA family ATPase [Sedimentitalea sp. JM2-8]|uniref:AAA family ATPase n=1 Tax=Sedimentitalea xiamensis TaxID=3050037 RepID=A0ABT7FK27_9RHOB|nr:AAA family ATPase [Sedimentitalea xiamensis]MDK3075506.1 AAA family ATPase [Sedimentitalea xiamensis]
MKLLKARFDGFRLLSGIELDFSVDPKRNITVIRAANESGKTTMLTALQWGLYGDDALPNGYSLRRMDLAPGTAATTRVEIEYEIDGRTGSKRFRLVRRVETQGTTGNRPASRVELYEVTDAGLDELPSPTNHIQQHLPSELREVFFTDGDRALSFIEGAKSAQQHKVRAAIERMMGLSLLEATIDHVKTVERQLRTKFDREAGNAETRTLEEQIERIDVGIPVKLQELESTKDRISNLTEKRDQADRDLQDALSAGNREELSKDLVNTRRQRENLEDQRKATEKRQAELLGTELLARHLMAKVVKKAGGMLDELRQKGQIPNKTVPILEDRLEHTDCICGESLDGSTPEGARRRKYIEDLIRDSREADDLRAKVSDLYYQAKPLFTGKPGKWSELYSEAFQERQRISSVYKDIGEKEAEIEAKLDKIPDINVQRLREIKQTYEKQLRDEIVSGAELDKDIKYLKEQRNDLEKKFRAESAKVSKGEKIARELSVATDIRNIVEASLARMKTVEVQSVSARMNDHFLSMIGADQESALITRAEITPEFRIVVYGRNGLEMDPSMDLNGASRRALTISFVLALTEISGVEGPNVIDTPLGMMSGFVKTEVVRTAADNSSQLILFLTHDEIKGCEEILDERAIVAATLTNPAHYPRILKNDPGTKEAVILQCACDHKSVCKTCDRYETSTQALAESA